MSKKRRHAPHPEASPEERLLAAIFGDEAKAKPAEYEEDDFHPIHDIKVTVTIDGRKTQLGELYTNRALLNWAFSGVKKHLRMYTKCLGVKAPKIIVQNELRGAYLFQNSFNAIEEDSILPCGERGRGSMRFVDWDGEDYLLTEKGSEFIERNSEDWE